MCFCFLYSIWQAGTSPCGGVYSVAAENETAGAGDPTTCQAAGGWSPLVHATPPNMVIDIQQGNK